MKEMTKSLPKKLKQKNTVFISLYNYLFKQKTIEGRNLAPIANLPKLNFYNILFL